MGRRKAHHEQPTLCDTRHVRAARRLLDAGLQRWMVVELVRIEFGISTEAAAEAASYTWKPGDDSAVQPIAR